MSLVDWLAQYSDDKSENFVRGFLGRMLFTQDESLKKVNVLSGGERVRMMLSKMMLTGSNVLILDDPLSHLDLESITSLNNSLIGFSQIILFASHDIEFVSSVANRIIEFTPKGVIDKYMNFEEYLEDKNIKELRDKMYGEHVSLT
ncbi:MAG: ABC transporter ATP-binding protein [uncultured bacterium]|nr:MAG: ABC transporter ATP-binding protein [uncultured bacterium]